MQVILRTEGEIVLGGEKIALSQLLALLERIAVDRSLAKAAESLDLSYRTAWGRLRSLEEAFGQPLVVKTKGHGSVLTAFGAEVRDRLGAAVAQLQAPLAETERRLGEQLALLLGKPRPALRIAASHDPVLMEWLAREPAAEPRFEVTVVGSGPAVERLLSGGADIAGFHIGGLTGGGLTGGDLTGGGLKGEAGSGHGGPGEAPFDQLFRDGDAFTVRPLFRREQGFLLAPGNPLGIGSVGDIAATGARFVNRQRGSGTRTWFDGLLRGAGLAPDAISGYGTEEFTHQAVAAVVASGAADAGMGVRAVAERFGLTFLPCGQETYYLACRGGLMNEPAVAALVAAVTEKAGGTAGYEAAAGAAVL